ncbi:MAG: BREX-1 system adenine-specific DNA-methyltransferase PglX, partial [Lutispora sp.]
KYYLEEAEQEPEVQKQLEEIRAKSRDIRPEDIKVLDPAMGSGHILVYAFDVLYDIYKSAGYSERDIPRLILENNLYGLDIDDRAAQLAYFAVMMKARSKSRRIFRENININVCAIQESNGFPKEAIDYLVNQNETEIEKQIRREDVEYLINVFHDAKEYGSILEVKPIDFDAIERRLEEIRKGGTQDLFEYHFRNIILEKIPPLVKQARIMSQKYDVVCTNPPYMGRKGMNQKLAKYVDDNYIQTRNDIFSVFIENGFNRLANNGYNSMVTMHSWMFLESYKNFRKEVISNYAINSILHLGYEAFDTIIGKVVQTVAFVIRKSMVNMKPQCIRLIDFYDSNRYLKESQFFNLSNRYNNLSQYDFFDIPGYTFAYWISKAFINCFKNGNSLESKSYVITKGIFTGNNERFIRFWFEVSEKNIPTKWHKYSKGGPYKKWYGNSIYVINWENDAYELRNFEGSGIGASKYYGLPHIVWSKVTTLDITFRKDHNDVFFDDASPAIVFNTFNTTILGFLNTKVCREIAKIIAPTLNYQIGDIKRFPIIEPENTQKEYIDSLTNKCVSISKNDWDSFEVSWDFKKHPLLTHKGNSTTIEQSFNNWSSFAEKQFNQLKNNEEELNRIFIEIYGLQDELTPDVEDKDVTISRIYNTKDDIPDSMKGNNYVLTKEDVIKSFISYAVGCMFGRYSIDAEGLIYAGGDFKDKWKCENGQWKVRKIVKDDEGKVVEDTWVDATFMPDMDNVLPITDDEYFEDDIVSRFIEFLKVTFGEDTLEENLDYIADTLGRKSSETARQAIRRYFLKDFYKDHVQVYQKKPIYWLFDSGKQDGFKALIYMHRYDEFTVARVRTDYLHKLQKSYEAEIKRLDIIIDSNVSQREKTNARKKKEKILKQMEECLQYDQVIAHVANQRIKIDLDD